jgi:hypothetical protein
MIPWTSLKRSHRKVLLLSDTAQYTDMLSVDVAVEGIPAKKVAEQSPVVSQKELADNPLGLRSEAIRPEGKRITEANTEYGTSTQA